MLGYQDATIWGSGILYSEKSMIWRRSKFRNLDIRAVRGPKTKQRLLENGYDVANCVFGDPVILTPDFYAPRDIEKKDYVVIHHMSDKTKKDTDSHMVDILTNDWKKTIDEIVCARLVISGSLHGIIIAESYKVPAIFLDRTEMNDHFKYEDYYLGTGRTKIPTAKSVEEALKMPLPRIPDLTALKEGLKKSFPADLWDE